MPAEILLLSGRNLFAACGGRLCPEVGASAHGICEKRASMKFTSCTLVDNYIVYDELVEIVTCGVGIFANFLNLFY